MDVLGLKPGFMPAAFLCADARLTSLRASPFWFKVQNCSGRGAPRPYKVQELVSPSLMVQ